MGKRKGAAPGAGGAVDAGPDKAVRPGKAKGALLSRGTNLVAVLFGVSLVVEKVVAGGAAG